MFWQPENLATALVAQEHRTAHRRRNHLMSSRAHRHGRQ
jgi:hypothetical protein